MQMRSVGVQKEHGSAAVNQLLVKDVELHRAGIQVMGAWPDDMTNNASATNTQINVG